MIPRHRLRPAAYGRRSSCRRCCAPSTADRADLGRASRLARPRGARRALRHRQPGYALFRGTGRARIALRADGSSARWCTRRHQCLGPDACVWDALASIGRRELASTQTAASASPSATSRPRPAPTSCRSATVARVLLIRQTLADWTGELPTTLSIDRVAARSPSTPPSDDDRAQPLIDRLGVVIDHSLQTLQPPIFELPANTIPAAAPAATCACGLRTGVRSEQAWLRTGARSGRRCPAARRSRPSGTRSPDHRPAPWPGA